MNSFLVYNQEKKSSFIIGAAPHYGFIIKHSGKLQGLTESNPFGVQISAIWEMMDEKSWQYCFCYPRTGISFLYTNFANPEIIGSSFALFPFVEPSINGEKKINGFLKFGFGPTYLNKVYDSVSNPENLFNSSHISFIVHLALGVKFRINNNLNIRLTGDYNHISNGGIKNPNIGINYPTAGFGAEYNFNPLPFTDWSKDKSAGLISYKNRFDLTVFGTGKTAVKGQEGYPVFGISGSASRVITRHQALSLSTEFTLDYADKKEIEEEHLLNTTYERDYKYLALLAGHEVILGRFIFYQQLGAYLYSPFKRRDRLYQRYGLSFFLNETIFVGINLKAHREVADFFDFRAGISF